jgi:hypothetical protein
MITTLDELYCVILFVNISGICLDIKSFCILLIYTACSCVEQYCMMLYDARVECDMVLMWSMKSSGLQCDVIWRKATQNSIFFVVTTMRASFVLCFYVIGYTENVECIKMMAKLH